MSAALAVLGVGLWTAEAPGVARWLAAAPQDAPSRPTGRGLPPAMRRRLSALTLAMVDALAEAAEAAGVGLGGLPAVFASAWGETTVLVDLLQQVSGPDRVASPIAFASSVHNAAAGYLSMATGNRGFATAIASGYDTVASGLFEVLGVAAAVGDPVLVVFGDLAEPAALVRDAAPRASALAAAMVLGAPSAGVPSRATLTVPRRERVAPSPWWGPTTALGLNPCCGALAIIDAVVRGVSGPVALDAGGGAGYSVVVDCSGGRP